MIASAYSAMLSWQLRVLKSWIRVIPIAATLLVACGGAEHRSAGGSFMTASDRWHSEAPLALPTPVPVEFVPLGFSDDQAKQIRRAWCIAGKVIADQAFKAALNALTSDSSGITALGVGPAAPPRSVWDTLEFGWAAWYRHNNRVNAAGEPMLPRLIVEGVRWRRQLPWETATASTTLGGNVIYLRRWRVHAPIEELAVTLIHEWLHTLGFEDPARGVTREATVVYGMENQALVLAKAATPGCQSE